MLRRYTFWLVAAILFQIIYGLLHILSFVVGPGLSVAADGEAAQLLKLFTAFSSSVPLLCVLGALTMGYLLVKHTEPAVMKNLIGIHAAVFGVCFVVMAVFALTPTIVMMGLIFVNLMVAYLICPKLKVTVDI